MFVLKSTHEATILAALAERDRIQSRLSEAYAEINNQAIRIRELKDRCNELFGECWAANAKLKPFRTYHRDARGRFVSVKGTAK